MTWTNINIGLKIEIQDKLLDSLIAIGKCHYPNEFGGFLIGFYSEDYRQLNITDHILPDKYKGTRYLFERDATGIDDKLKEFYNQNPQKYYVGEWHTHPDNLPIPSSTDIDAMKSIAAHGDVAIKNPALLIIGYNHSKVEIGFYALLNHKLYKYDTL
ncbi:Mov34/MPN/PAD-1 family protein [Rurimicrobium arvi]|uniref:JAB domain-containing protein n=1 Tax=Rurimicrobium arvi TaxID=2049916 RepID=A0ABP8MX48_9BACT